MFFDRFKQLCEDRGVSVYRACVDIGLNRSAVAKWKSGGQPNGPTTAKLADYFGVTTDYLLCKSDNQTPIESTAQKDILDEVDVAFYGDFKELDEDDKETVRDMVRIMRERRSRKQG